MQCHVAWVGQPGCGDSDRGDEGLVTLVVGWGPDLELLSWRAQDLERVAVAEGAGPSQLGTPPGGCGQCSPASRRALLLGVPGPLSAATTGPFGSVLATTSTGLALSSLRPAAQSPAPEGVHSPTRADGASSHSKLNQIRSSSSSDGRSGSADAGPSGVRAGVQEPPRLPVVVEAAEVPEVVDLRGRLAAPGLDDASASEPSLAALLGITSAASGLRADTAGRPSGLTPAGRPVPNSFLLPAEGPAATASGSAASISAAAPGAPPEAVAPAALCVVWPGGLAHAGTAAGRTAEGPPGRWTSSHGGGFRSVAALALPRPDLLSCCGRLVLVGSVVGPPVVAAFELDPVGGLSQLALLALDLPGLTDPARGRLQGLAAVLPAGPRAQSRAGLAVVRDGSGSRGGDSAGDGAELVVVVGEVAAGGGIVGFGRDPRWPPEVRMAPLLLATHRLPPRLAAAAAASAAVAESAAMPCRAAALQPASPLSPEASSAAPAAAPAAIPVAMASAPQAAPAAPAGVASDALAAAVVGQLAELLGGLRAHVDGRLDALAGSLQAHASRLDRIEATLMAQQQPQAAQAVQHEQEEHN
ncbi:hypothetical protein GPECTOR_64g136 [Gonium pectorale]|uniref:Uncharacterized protein n=1 Tax=Gonium pectorale TaxID=33097 RepID=A0A150G447_GONPE|nr:hypothetical protein GPECTOR_64g136 [Gonium pectorale]|eukprot:KXZ44642.1 hypothetical protein GPECTOR_64g136 [Gonium pectorale]